MYIATELVSFVIYAMFIFGIYVYAHVSTPYDSEQSETF